MTLKKQIKQNLEIALKGKKRVEVSTLRMLNAAILNKEKEKRYKISKEKPELKPEKLEEESQLIDGEIIQVLQSEIKKRKEAILEFEKGERQDLVNKEKAEMDILQKYMPEQLSEEEIKKIVKTAIEKVGAKEPRDMGKVMGELMPKVKGRADGGIVSRIVKELLVSKED